MKGCCPGCERPTFWKPRGARSDRKRVQVTKPDGYMYAVTVDGCCATCWRDRNGKTRAAAVSPTLAGVGQRPPMTDTELLIARRALDRMTEGRRRRGVPADGIDPERIQRRGLALIDV